MNDMELAYRKATEAAMKLPPEEGVELIAAATVVYSSWKASDIAFQAMIEASAKPVTVAM